MKFLSLRRLAIIIGLIFLVGLLGSRLFMSAEFKAQGNPVPDCKTSFFTQSAVVFDAVRICATSEVPKDKLIYAANVVAEWLDNDGDGIADEPRLIDTLKSNKPVVIMSANGFSNRAMIQTATALRGHRIQDLSSAETNPLGDRRDASQEETHHIIMNAGWQPLYPTIFSETTSDNSTLYQAWKFADDNSHYVYNDPTCDDSCKVTEFVYLATAAYFGSAADLQSDEMRLKNRAELAQTIPSVIEIFESNAYTYSTDHWPTGEYAYPDNIRLNP